MRVDNSSPALPSTHPPSAPTLVGVPDDDHAGVITSIDPPSDVVPYIEHRGGNAPADEYFGRSKMSILGIRNVVHDTNERANGASESKAHELCHNLMFAEDAFRDWQARYPGDAWILESGYGLVDDFAKLDALLPNEEPHTAAIHSIDLNDWLDAQYPGNRRSSR